MKYSIRLGLALLSSSVPLMAGPLDPPSAPGSTSSYTIGDICNRLDTGAAGSQISFTEPTSAPSVIGCTFNEVMGKAPVINASGALPGEVLAGREFWGLVSGTWGLQTGTLATQTPTDASVSQPAGNYNAFDLATVDADLAIGNVRSGVNVFGIVGDSNVVDTNSGDATAADIASGKKAWVNGVEITGTASIGGGSVALPRTGQTTCYDAAGATISCTGTGQDGDKLAGTAWPNPRFTDNSNGTVTDNLTGLIWLKNANCFGTKNWTTALSDAANLSNSSCGLTDDSSAGDWRLPNRVELASLTNIMYRQPCMSNATGTAQWSEGDAFTGVMSDFYWSSSSVIGESQSAWGVHFWTCEIMNDNKEMTPMDTYMWPVRGGQ